MRRIRFRLPVRRSTAALVVAFLGVGALWLAVRPAPQPAPVYVPAVTQPPTTATTRPPATSSPTTATTRAPAGATTTTTTPPGASGTTTSTTGPASATSGTTSTTVLPHSQSIPPSSTSSTTVP